jgi:hypothetical protein
VPRVSLTQSPVSVPVSANEGTQVSTVAVVHHDVNFVIELERLPQADDVGVGRDLAHASDLSVKLFDVSGFREILDFDGAVSL